MLKDISNKAGQSGYILGAYFESDQFDAMEKFAQTKLKESNIDLHDQTYNKDRTPYSLTDNNCGTFASDVINQDKNVKNPWWSIKTPTNMVDEFLEEEYEKVFYNSETQQTTFEK